MCEIFNFEIDSNKVKCETNFGVKDKKGSICGQITTIGIQTDIHNKSSKANYLRRLCMGKDEKILSIDFFYPLTEAPDKAWLGFGKGIECLNQFIEAVKCCKIIIFTSVSGKDEDGIIHFLENHNFTCISNGGNADYIKVDIDL